MDEQTFLGAVTTEHIASQAARSAIVAEQVGRAMLYMGAVSSALITFGYGPMRRTRAWSGASAL